MAFLAPVANPLAALELEAIRTAAGTLGVAVMPLEIRRLEDIAAAFEGLKGRADALYVPPDPILISELSRINTLALSARLPTVYGSREYLKAGGLLSYGPDFEHLFGRAADYVNRILRGAKAGDLPIEQPTRFELVVNVKTAKALGLTIPPSLLQRADQVIE